MYDLVSYSRVCLHICIMASMNEIIDYSCALCFDQGFNRREHKLFSSLIFVLDFEEQDHDLFSTRSRVILVPYICFNICIRTSTNEIKSYSRALYLLQDFD